MKNSIIRIARKKKGLSIQKLADESKISTKTITTYENFGTLNPYPKTLKKLCDYLELNYEDVINQFIERS